MKLNFLNVYFLFVLICISISTPSCDWNDYQPHPFLQEAELLLDTAPDSAYRILLKADTISWFSSSQRAEWNLLITQAMDKAYMNHTSDSLIREAVIYYDKTKEIDKQVRAYYTWGRVLQELGDSPRAQECYLEALSKGKILQDLKLLACIENNLGMLYTYQGAYDIALEHMEEAVQYYIELSDSMAMSSALRDKGRIYGRIKQTDFAIESYLKALLYFKEGDDLSILRGLGSLYTEKEEYDTAYFYLSKAFPADKNSVSYFPACLSMGKYFVAINHRDSAYYYLNQSVESPRLDTRAGSYHYLAQLAYENSQWEEYLSLNSISEDLRIEIEEKKYNETVQRIQHLYNYSLVRNEAEKIKYQHAITQKNNLLLLLFSLFILTLLFLYIFYVKQERKKWQTELDELLDEANADKEKLENNKRRLLKLEDLLKNSGEQEIESLSKEINLLERMNRAIELKDETKRYQNEQFHATAIYHYFQSVNDFGKITEKEKRELFRTIDMIYPDFNETIKTYIPEIKPLELDFCYYTKAGLKQVDIGRLCSLGKTAIGMRFSRLGTKIAVSEKISNEKFRKWIESI